ncbi:hypothetical protein VTP01DRAFT_4207 [Rhizomucor pusillus]|uniref:uncharacterized protein n=1 Tax=Rhizomucor pusillus TaxID=4840 RepID=UPI00374410AC
MASGFGINGGNYQHDSNLFWLKHFLRVYLGRGRCFHFWQEFSKCYASADFPTQCNAERDDYLECLHHTKEFARVTRIKAEELKQAEKRKQLKKEANAAADSNLPQLNIIDGKQTLESKA